MAPCLEPTESPKNNEAPSPMLVNFIHKHSDWFHGSARETCRWLVSEDITKTEYLTQAASDDEYLESMLGCNGGVLKQSKLNAFKEALLMEASSTQTRMNAESESCRRLLLEMGYQHDIIELAMETLSDDLEIQSVMDWIAAKEAEIELERGSTPIEETNMEPRDEQNPTLPQKVEMEVCDKSKYNPIEETKMEVCNKNKHSPTKEYDSC